MLIYKTQPGTLPHRVVELLRRHPGSEFATVEICDELDADPTSFCTSMATAKRHGVLRCRKIPGRAGNQLFWSLGDGTPEPRPADYEPDKPFERKPRKKVEAPAEPAQLPMLRPIPEPEDFRAALWTDGSLILVGTDRRPDGTVVLGANQTSELRKLLAWSPM